MAVLDDAGRLACLRLIRSENVGPVTFRELINHYGGAEKALAVLPELSRRAGRSGAIAICPASRAEAELEAARRLGARPIFTIEPGYPPALASLDAPPPLLYVKGREELLGRPMVAMVGSRNASAAGTRMARMLATRIGAEGYVVVSGLARGIDSATHEAALATGTVAVLAGGIDFVYPPENEDLYARIADKGCLVTELPPGFQPRAQDFPRRNRIISGVALATIVVEAAKRSGSLITARTANEQGRLVMAVPGHPLDPRAEGPNGLIRQGAIMITSADEVVAELAPLRHRAPGAEPRPTLAEPPVSTPLPAPRGQAGTGSIRRSADAGIPGSSPVDAVEAVLGVLGPAPATLDEVARAAGIPAHVAKVALLELALAGRIEQHGGQLVSLRSE
ncbi:MAG: DNA-processing protein DprA [Hyphomicrobiaceae bacterium]|nr:DNA-processing protein DprA [Hyphomicrobiaceae bacterium]